MFDLANPNLVSGKRNISTLPTQALFLMNSPMIMQRSQQAADRLLAQQGLNDRQRLDLAYRRTLGRLPSSQERKLMLQFVGDLNEQEPAAWSYVFQTLFACIDFRYLD